MKKLIYFHAQHLVDGVGQSQLVEDLEAFIEERKSKLIDAEVIENKLIFTKPNGDKGYAMIFNVPNDFEN